MTEPSDSYFDDTSPPRLARDGVTVLVPLRGKTEEGVFYDGFLEIHPGDERYEELLPIARRNPLPPPVAADREPDPASLAWLLGEHEDENSGDES